MERYVVIFRAALSDVKERNSFFPHVFKIILRELRKKTNLIDRIFGFECCHFRF